MTGTGSIPDRGPRVRPSRWPPVLQLVDVASLLGMKSRRAALKVIRRERIPHVTLGRRVLVLLSSMLDFLKARETTTEPGDRLAEAADRLRGCGNDSLNRAVADLTNQPRRI